MAIATFAAGCFWGVQSTFDKLTGVNNTAVGYSGGHTENPNYNQVCAGNTGHAEALQVEYDESLLSYEVLLKTFWECHNPTTLNQQGPDVGSQYRSVIFYHDDGQKALAIESKQALDSSGTYDKPIVTEIIPASTFWRAEEYHQDYFKKNGMRG